MVIGPSIVAMATVVMCERYRGIFVTITECKRMYADSDAARAALGLFAAPEIKV